jgi:hypothetical protein
LAVAEVPVGVPDQSFWFYILPSQKCLISALIIHF